MHKLWYNLTITALSVFVALFIGGMEILGLAANRLGLEGGVWSAVAVFNADLTHFGFATIGIFVLVWGMSALLFRWMGYERPTAAVRSRASLP